MNAPLTVAAQNDRRLRDELIARFPSLADDEPALLDTLDGESDFDRQVGIALRMLDEAEMMADGVAKRIDELGARWKRLGERAGSIRSAVLAAMEAAGRRKVTLPEATLSTSWRKGGLIITDEAAIPPGPWWVEQPAKLSKTALKEAVEGGQEIAGTAIGNGSMSLTIRRG